MKIGDVTRNPKVQHYKHRNEHQNIFIKILGTALCDVVSDLTRIEQEESGCGPPLIYMVVFTVISKKKKKKRKVEDIFI